MRKDEDRDVGTLSAVDESAVDERDVVAISVSMSAFSRISTRRLRGHTTIGLVTFWRQCTDDNGQRRWNANDEERRG